MERFFLLFLTFAASFKFIVFSDLHYSPSPFCKGLNNNFCDASEELLKSALAAMSSVLPSPDLIVSLGDEISHGHKSPFILRSIISHLFEAYSEAFPATLKLHTIGNNEGFYLHQTPRDYLDHLAFLYQYWIPSTWRNYDFLQYGYYSLEIENTKFIVLHSSLFYSDGRAATEHLNWVENELMKTKNASVVFLTHSPPVNSMFNNGERLWTDQNLLIFRELLRKYKGIIIAVLSGHLHRGIFSSIFEIPVLINPSISSLYNSIPSFRVYELVDGYLDFEEFTLNEETWERSYKFSEEFQSISNIPSLVKFISPNSETQDKILKLSRGYSPSSTPNIEQIYQISTNSTLELEKLRKVVWCSLQDLKFEEFCKCKE